MNSSEYLLEFQQSSCDECPIVITLMEDDVRCLIHLSIDHWLLT